MTELNSKLEALDEAIRAIGDGGPSTVLQEILAALYAVQRSLTTLADVELACAKTEVTKLTLRPGDALIVKLGDRATGWIPGPDVEARARELFIELVQKDMGLDIPILVYHYGVELATIRRDAARATAAGAGAASTTGA